MFGPSLRADAGQYCPGRAAVMGSGRVDGLVHGGVWEVCDLAACIGLCQVMPSGVLLAGSFGEQQSRLGHACVGATWHEVVHGSDLPFSG